MHRHKLLKVSAANNVTFTHLVSIPFPNPSLLHSNPEMIIGIGPKLTSKLEEYLVTHREEYFEHSARNYTAEQRKYNNDLTRGLLDVAAEEGYVFEEFTFPMLRDRIRCYYKSYSQAVKKKVKLESGMDCEE